MPPKGSKMVRPSAAPASNGDPKRDLPFAFTTFSVPPPVNAKNIASQYLRTDAQTWLARSIGNPAAKVESARRALKRARAEEEDENMDVDVTLEAHTSDEEDDLADEDGEGSKSASSKASNTIVIHPGSHSVRIGLATDLNPITLPQALARKDELTTSDEVSEIYPLPDKDELSSSIEGLRSDLKTIMRNLKLRGMTNGRQQATSYNGNVSAEIVPEHNDVFAVDWTIAEKVTSKVVIGEKAERMDCFSSGEQHVWKLFRPFTGGQFNLEAYQRHYGSSSALSALLADIQLIWSHAITSPKEDTSQRQEAGQVIDVGLGIPAKEWSRYNVVLVVPDLYILSEIESLVRLLLEDMGFAGIIVQQEGVCSTFGAGLSSSCVVHVGGDRTTISCVEEGLIVAESRMILQYGGRDVSRFFSHLLKRINFPYHSLDIDKRLADFWLAEQLKERFCTLDAAQLALLISDFHLRLPKQKTRKYSLRIYDEIILAPMALFSPNAFFIDAKRPQSAEAPSMGAVIEDDTEEAEETTVSSAITAAAPHSLPTTTAMNLCVRHLLPPPPPTTVAATQVAAELESAQGTPSAPAKAEPPATEPISLSDPTATASSNSGAATPASKIEETVPVSASDRASPSVPAPNGASVNEQKTTAPSMDVLWEAGKMPLDFAVWNSILASISNLGSAGPSEERVRRMTTNIICTGATALIPGLGFALEARLNNYLVQWNAQQSKDANGATSSSVTHHATVVPPPRDMDPRIIAWKGMSVLARLDSAQEMWIPKNDWETFGVRALKEKTLFL